MEIIAIIGIFLFINVVLLINILAGIACYYFYLDVKEKKLEIKEKEYDSKARYYS